MAKKEYGFHAIVLAGGLGTRLREVIGQTPKPLASIADRPFLAYLLEFMANQRVSTVILSIGSRMKKSALVDYSPVGILPVMENIGQTEML